MNLATLLLLGLMPGAGQPAADYFPLAARSLKLDIDYDPQRRSKIRQVQLVVSPDEGQTWYTPATVTPDKDHFVFTADQDGLYWVNMVIVYQDGTLVPPDVSRVAPAQKLLIDATQPTVALTKLDWDDEYAVVDWKLDDAYPNDAVTEISYRAAGPIDTGWEPVAGANIVGRSARFKPSATGAIVVRVTVKDLAGNSGTTTRELAAPVTTGVGVNAVSAGSSEPFLLPGATAADKLPSTNVGGPAAPLAVPTMTPPSAPASPPSFRPPEITASVTPPPSSPSSTQPWSPPADTGATGTGSPAPIAVGSGATAGPAAEASGLQVINYTRFDLQYQVDNGPSGIRQIDLYVTRDGGRSWTKWSQHDGQTSPLRVALDVPGNPQVEGDYGFRMVAVSGAGLSDGPPTPGTPPEMQAHVDVTPPIVKVYAPTADPNRRNTLLLHWEATDRNFGADPIAIDWSEHPSGPWQPVAAGGGLVPVVAGDGSGGPRVANTGTYAWALPPNLGTHRVYLRFTAWDRGGNRSQVVTPSPVMVDLTKPTVRIQGIVGGITPTSGLVGGITPAP